MDLKGTSFMKKCIIAVVMILAVMTVALVSCTGNKTNETTGTTTGAVTTVGVSAFGTTSGNPDVTTAPTTTVAGELGVGVDTEGGNFSEIHPVN